jgi:hypothetical protein
VQEGCPNDPLQEDVARFRRKVQMRTSEIITLCDLCSQGIELRCGCWWQVSRSYHRSLANRVHDFSAGDRTARRPKRLKPKHRTRESFHGAVVLFHNMIKIFGMADNNGGLVRSFQMVCK